jgi:hypothetical protein
MSFDWVIFATMLMAIRKKSLGISITIAVSLFTAPISMERPETGIGLLMNAVAASPPAPKSLRLLRGCLERCIMGVERLRYMIDPAIARRHAHASPAPCLCDRCE